MAEIGFRRFALMTLCVLVMLMHMYLIHNVLEQVFLTVLVPFPNSSMRTNELPVLLLTAWAIWRIDTKCYILHFVLACVCVMAVGSSCFIKNYLTGGEWEWSWRTVVLEDHIFYFHTHIH